MPFSVSWKKHCGSQPLYKRWQVLRSTEQPANCVLAVTSSWNLSKNKNTTCCQVYPHIHWHKLQVSVSALLQSGPIIIDLHSKSGDEPTNTHTHKPDPGRAVRLNAETSLDELLTLIVKLMNIVIHSTIHLSYLKVTDYFTEIMCLGLQMKTTQDHSLSSRQIKFQTLLL